MGQPGGDEGGAAAAESVADTAVQGACLDAMSLQHRAVQMRPASLPAPFTVEPVVIMSILDHYKRRNAKQQRVIGTLLGVRLPSGQTQIKDSFPVPHNEQDDQVVAVDMDYHRAMLELYTRVSSTLTVVGWYTTGSLTQSSVTISRSFQSMMSGQRPVILAVDTSLEGSKLSVCGYTPSVITSSADATPLLGVFDEVDVEFVAFDDDKIAIDALIQSQPDDDRFDSPATLLTQQQGLQMSVESLHSMLADVCDYVDRVVSGEIEPDNDVGRLLASAVSAVPQAFDGEWFEGAFQGSVSDLLSVSYLSSLTRAQLAIADKVNVIA